MNQLEEVFDKTGFQFATEQLSELDIPISTKEFTSTSFFRNHYHRHQVTDALMRFLRDELRFINNDYVIKKRMGKGNYGIAPYFNGIELNGNRSSRGFAKKLLTHCIGHKYRIH